MTEDRNSDRRVITLLNDLTVAIHTMQWLSNMVPEGRRQKACMETAHTLQRARTEIATQHEIPPPTPPSKSNLTLAYARTDPNTGHTDP